MAPLDWIIVVLLNGATIAVALFISRGAHSSSEWFLAGRTLSWWVVGLSLYATAIDASDVVADSGGVYSLGLSYFVTNWVGVILGWLLAAHVVVIVMFRCGMYTNAEYLEARFGSATRIISALVQIQYRTMVLGIIANTLYLTLAIVCDWGRGTWWAVVLIALIATLYTAWGGLKSVAITDAFQSFVMVAAMGVMLMFVWQKVGGFDGAAKMLDAHEPQLSNQILHVGHDRVEKNDVSGKTPEQIENLLLLGGMHDTEKDQIVKTSPAWLVCMAWVIAGMAYSLVNHTQSMRMLGARSEWDLKMSVVVAAVVILGVSFFSLVVGAFGRAIYPDPSMMPLANETLKQADSIYPLLIRDLLPIGIKGLVIAGILAASFSTFDSIGSTLSALITRDIYARVIRKNEEDAHYLKLGRWLTPVIIFGSFLYVPFLKGGMLLFYLDLVGAFVVPLLTVYLLGATTPVHRRTGTIGLLCGVLYGALRLLAPVLAEKWGMAILPPVMLDSFAAYPFSVLATALPMFAVSLVLGWSSSKMLEFQDEEGWLRTSQEEARALAAAQPPKAEARSLPLYLGLGLWLVGLFLSFVVFW